MLRKLHKYHARLKEGLRPDAIRNIGFCPICDRPTTFFSKDTWFRDHYLCVRCKSIPRERALMVVLQEHYPDWRSMVIHESSPVNRGVSRLLSRECRHYIPTQYFADHPPGSDVKGVRCEDLERLTFADESVDLHITQDVFEHIMDPPRAFGEIARTLSQGGAHIFTVPLVNKDRPSKRRAHLKEDGSVLFLETPEYHGNPVDPKGSLVTVDWGFDVVAQIQAACGLDTQVIRLDDLSRGIRAEYIEVLVTKKPRRAAQSRTSDAPAA